MPARFGMGFASPQAHAQAIAAERRHHLLVRGCLLPTSPDVSSISCNAKAQIPNPRLFQSQHALAVGPQAQHVG